MIIISARKSFDSPDALHNKGHIIKEIDISSGKAIRLIKGEEDFLREIEGLRVLLLVHGYNNEQDEVYDAYSVIEKKVGQHLGGIYDLIIGYSWPGGDEELDWWISKKRANKVAKKFRFLIENISTNAQSLDVISHSLGARVVLKAIAQSENESVVRNCYCTAPAVDNEVLEKGEEFYSSLSRIGSLYIFHSKNDIILSTAYRVAEFDNALGLYGPEDKQYIQGKTKNVYVANCKKYIESHGEYKRSDAVYSYIASALIKKPIKFKTL